MPASLKVSGQAETAHAFDKLADDIEKMNDVHKRIAAARIPGIAFRTPVLTGELRGSWEAEGAEGSGSILSPLPRSIFLEYGTRYIAPVGMVVKTFEAEAQQVAKDYEQAIKDMAKKRGFKTDG